MPIAITEEQKSLVDSVSEFNSRHAALTETRTTFEELACGGRPTHWQHLVDLGLHAVHLPEEYGGQGGTLEDLAVAVETAAKGLLPGPFLATVMASAAASLAEDCKCRTDLLRSFATGVTGAIVLPGKGITATPSGTDLVLSGNSVPVSGLMSAEVVIVGVETDNGVLWLRLEPQAEGVTREKLDGVDLTTDLGRLTLHEARLGQADRLRALDPTTAHATAIALMTADVAGVMQWCVDATAAYAKVREQFGQPIGKFQAVKHKLARLLIAAELASAVAADAIRSLGQDRTQQRLAACTAIAVGIGRSVDAVVEAISLHGGIAYTWEHDAHLYWRRAISIAAQAGSVRNAMHDLGEASMLAKRDFSLKVGAHDDPEFRKNVAATLDKALELPEDVRFGDNTLTSNTRGPRRDFIAESGIATPHWPPPYGLGANIAQQLILSEEFAKRDMIPPRIILGNWAVPTILAHGTEQQKERFAGPTQRGEIWWCQLFSEPGAGSDLASLRTKADKVGGGWVLNGQKVWTTYAHEADWAICLARTEPDAEQKHRGLSYFLVDMKAPGITVHPLRQPSGEAEFNEVFLDDVFVADDQLLGERGQGWQLTLTTLMNERLMISSAVPSGDDERLRGLIKGGQYCGTRDQAIDALGEIVAETSSVAALNLREAGRRLHGDLFSPGGSVVKVAAAELSRKSASIVLDVVGPEAARWDAPGDVVHSETRVPAFLLGGGTVEVQLNIIAERILGLPRG